MTPVDSNQGQRTQQDPIGLAGGLNLYGYAGGDPINFADPFGLCPHCRVSEKVAKAVVKASAASAADGPLPIGDAVGLAILVAAVSEAIDGGNSGQAVPIYHRLTEDATEAELVKSSGELWGGEPRNYHASDIPKAKAYTGPLPAGKSGYEFITMVRPDKDTPPGQANWSGPRPGVRVEHGWAKIPVRMTRNTTGTP